jgi:Glycosyl transferase family 2
VTEAPAVCVALSVKDGGAYLPGSIESILAQEGVALELRIYDNGSTDGSLDVYERYRADPRVSVTTNPAGSTFFDSMNRALAETSAPWFVPWAADDLMRPANVATKVAAARRSGARLAYGPVVSLDGEGRCGRTLSDEAGGDELVFDPPGLFCQIVPWNTVPMPSVVADAAELRAVGGFDPRLALCGDWMMWLRLSLRVRGVYVPEPGVAYREHDANATHTARRAGAFASELVATLRAAFRDPALPPSWLPTLPAHLVTILRAQASSHLESGLARVSQCSHPAYLLAFEALLLDPDSASARAQFLDAVRVARLPETSFPAEIVAAPDCSAEGVSAAMRGIRRLLTAPRLIGHIQIAAHPDALDEMIALVERDLACNGDVDLELSLTPDPTSLLRPGGMLVVELGDPRARIVEQLYGATVVWAREPDPLEAEAPAGLQARAAA